MPKPVRGWHGLPPGTTRCRDCEQVWSGVGRAHCTVCHWTFGSNGTADRHWINGRHVMPTTVEGLKLVDDWLWVRADAPESLRLSESSP